MVGMVAFPPKPGYYIILLVHRRVASGLRLGLIIFVIFLPADPLASPFSMVARNISSSEVPKVLSNHAFGLPVQRKSLFRRLEISYTKNTAYRYLSLVTTCRLMQGRY